MTKLLIFLGKAYVYVSCRAKPYWYRLLWALRGQRVEIGRNFKVLGKLSISGPGRVVIGDNVTVGFHVRIRTEFNPNAVLRIGNNVFLNGTSFGCADSITVGDDCILADCRIIDTDYHGVNPSNRGIAKTAPVWIGNNVWITMQCIVLKGVAIADGCTVMPMSVVNKSLLTPNSVYCGNPAVFIQGIKS